MSVMPVFASGTDALAGDTARSFLESCSSTPATPQNLALVAHAASLLRTALEDETVAPLRDFFARAREWCTNLSDILAAAQHVVVDTVLASESSAVAVAQSMRRIAEIARQALTIDVLDGRTHPMPSLVG